MPTLADALELAGNGWAIVPLAGKVPVTARGVLDATTDEGTICRWWRTVPHNIGARVPDQLLVLDFDPQHGGDRAALEDAAGTPLPTTLTVHSGRGTGGQHRYYRHPGGQVTASRLPTGIDVKTSSGYCVMPPSLHPATGQPYRWDLHAPAALPAPLVALLRPAVPPSAAHRHRAGAGEHLVRYVEQLTEGGRNAGLYWAACRAVDDREPAETFDALAAAGERIGLDPLEVRRTIASARRQVTVR